MATGELAAGAGGGANGWGVVLRAIAGQSQRREYRSVLTPTLDSSFKADESAEDKPVSSPTQTLL